MITNWLANLHDLDKAIYDLFWLPGTFVLSQIGAYAPELALKLGIGVEGNGVVLSAIVSLLVWSLSLTLVWKTVRAVFARNTAVLETFSTPWIPAKPSLAGLLQAAGAAAARIRSPEKTD